LIYAVDARVGGRGSCRSPIALLRKLFWKDF
jgi:hypothetical protein